MENTKITTSRKLSQFHGRTIAVLILLYIINSGFLLLSRGVYWDGWWLIILAKPDKVHILKKILDSIGQFAQYHLLSTVGQYSNPLLLVKFIAFFSWLIAGVALFAILTKLAITHKDSFFIAAFFLLSPHFITKGDPSVILYPVSTMLFFLAAFVYFYSENDALGFIKIFKQFLALVLFFGSFFTNSYLVFYAGFLLFSFGIFHRKQRYQKITLTLFLWFKKHVVFVFLPLLFWGVKLMFWQPYGVESHYNEFVFHKNNFVIPFLNNAWSGFVYGFFWPLVAPITILDRKIFAVIFLFVATTAYLLTKRILNDAHDNEYDVRPIYYVLVGAVLFLLGLFPYIVVGKNPHIFGYGFGMRHALLLPLGSALITCGAIHLVMKTEYQNIAKIILLALFITFNIYNYYLLDMDWYKQRSIIEDLKSSTEPRIVNASSFIYDDRLLDFNWQGRQISQSEYVGHMYAAFHRFDILALGKGDNIDDQYRVHQNLYISPDFKYDSSVVTISITTSATSESMTVYHWLTLKKYELFYDDVSFVDKLKKILQIQVTSI